MYSAVVWSGDLITKLTLSPPWSLQGAGRLEVRDGQAGETSLEGGSEGEISQREVLL